MTPTSNRPAILLLVAALFLLAAAPAASAETPKEAVGFWGKITATVKSAQPDGLAFVVTVTAAKADPNSTAKDDAALIGKDLTLGTRMPKKDGKTPTPHEADVAFIKTLTPGLTVNLDIFATRSDPTTLRIQKPGQITSSATQPATNK